MSRLIRSVSGVERIWLAAEGLTPPFCNQMVIEGEGVLPLAEAAHGWQRALHEVSCNYPGARMRLAGRLSSLVWEEGDQPPLLRVVDGGGWDGRSGANAPFLRALLSPKTGPVAEVVLVHGAVPRVVIRTHHAAFDGQGTLLLAEDFFKALRGEPVRETCGGPQTDYDLACASGRVAETSPEADCESWQEPAGCAETILWARETMHDVPNMPLAGLLHVLAQTRRKSRFDIPVDMRRHMPGLRSTANLTGLIRLEVTPEEGPAAIHSRLHESIARREEADFVLGAQRVVGVPLWLMRRAGRYAARKCYENHRFVCSATVSNLGNLDARRYSGDGFSGSRVFFIPPGGLALPLFIALTGGEWGLEICAAAPGRLTDQAGLTSLLAEVAEKLGRMEIKD